MSRGTQIDDPNVKKLANLILHNPSIGFDFYSMSYITTLSFCVTKFEIVAEIASLTTIPIYVSLDPMLKIDAEHINDPRLGCHMFDPKSRYIPFNGFDQFVTADALCLKALIEPFIPNELTCCVLGKKGSFKLVLPRTRKTVTKGCIDILNHVILKELSDTFVGFTTIVRV